MSGVPAMGIGDAVRTTSIRVQAIGQMREVGWQWLSYRANKGKRFVFLCLGVENADGTEPVKPEARLRATSGAPVNDLPLDGQ